MKEAAILQRCDEVSVSELALLRAAGASEAVPTAAHWSDFRGQVKPGDESKAEQRLLPLVCRNLLRHRHTPENALKLACLTTLGSNARILDAGRAALHALNRASIPTMVLKGAALLSVHYHDLGSRPMHDFDVLVPSDRIEEALDVLEAEGWRGDPARRWLSADSHADALISHESICLDLHRHATYEARYAAADEAFFADAQPVSVAGVPTLAMCAGDQLLHSVVHGLRWTISPSSIWVIDALTILRSGQVDVLKTVARARTLRLNVALAEGLEVVRQVFGPNSALDALSAALGPHPRFSSDRLEQWFRAREPAGWLGALPNLAFAYRRSSPEGTTWNRFPEFLRQAWRLETEQSLVSVLAGKARKRLTSRP